MNHQKLWAWQILVVNGRVGHVSASPIDYATRRGAASTAVRIMYVRDADYFVEIDAVAASRMDAERAALEIFERDVPNDMRGV